MLHLLKQCNCKLGLSDYLAVYPLNALQAPRPTARNKQHALFICADHSVPNSLKQVTSFWVEAVLKVRDSLAATLKGLQLHVNTSIRAKIQICHWFNFNCNKKHCCQEHQPSVLLVLLFLSPFLDAAYQFKQLWTSCCAFLYTSLALLYYKMSKFKVNSLTEVRCVNVASVDAAFGALHFREMSSKRCPG